MGKDDQMQFRLPAELKKDFLRIADEVDRPASLILRELMRDYVNQVRKPVAASTTRPLLSLMGFVEQIERRPS